MAEDSGRASVPACSLVVSDSVAFCILMLDFTVWVAYHSSSNTGMRHL